MLSEDFRTPALAPVRLALPVVEAWSASQKAEVWGLAALLVSSTATPQGKDILGRGYDYFSFCIMWNGTAEE
jgi:hypothetical protein